MFMGSTREGPHVDETEKYRHNKGVAYDPRCPYNDLPMLPPSADVESRPVLRKAIAARAALEGLKYAGRSIPNQTVLLRSIVLQEARSSSEIENIVTTNDELYRAFSSDEESSSPQTKEVLQYSRAVWHGYELVRKHHVLDEIAFKDLATIIKRTPIEIRRGFGTRIGNARTGDIIYTPPEGEENIRKLLENLVSYQLEQSDLDPLICTAIGHYQFEAIHPFPDGNGRTGRVLNILWMVEKALLEVPVLYLSRAIIDSKAEYYAGLRGVTERMDWEAWISYFLEIIEVTAIETRRRIELIRQLIDAAKLKARSLAPKIYSSELIDLVFDQPYTRIAFLERAGIAKRQTASKYLQELAAIGLLRSQREWKEALYVNDALMEALI